MGLFTRLISSNRKLISSLGQQRTYLRDAYHCNEAWARRLQTPLLQKVVTDDLFFEMDQKYQADKVISAVDVDVYINKIEDTEALDEMEELAFRLRKSPATADTLPSTSHALIKAFLKGKKINDLMRILDDRLNYGIFVDFHIANILMDELLKDENHRDAVKVASLLMLEEDFGSSTCKFFSLISCLKYLKEPKPEKEIEAVSSAEAETKEEDQKVRLKEIRNVYFDQHFDLFELDHLLGKTLAKVGEIITEDENVSRSVQLMGWAVYGKWDKVNALVQSLSSSRKPIYPEAMKVVSDLVDKALAQLEASPTKTLPKQELRQFPGMNLEEKEVAEFWKRVNHPKYEKDLPAIKSKLGSNELQVTNDKEEGALLKRAEHLLSAALSEREDAEIVQQTKMYAEWDVMRIQELDKQIRRFKAFKLTEDIEARKRELREKEEVIFFFDHEEEWMMKLPPDEQKGYTLDTKYVDRNSVKFVKVIPPKKIRKKKTIV